MTESGAARARSAGRWLWVFALVVPSWAGAWLPRDLSPEVTEAMYEAVETQEALAKSRNPRVVRARDRVARRLEKDRRDERVHAARTKALQLLDETDASFPIVISDLRSAVQGLTRTPEGLEVVAAFNDDREAEAVAMLSRLERTRFRELQWSLALAEEALQRGKLDRPAMTALRQQLVERLEDPSFDQPTTVERERWRVELRRALAEELDSPEALVGLEESLADLAGEELEVGAYGASLQSYAERLELARRLNTLEEPLASTEDVARALLQLGTAKVLSGDWTSAPPHFAEGWVLLGQQSEVDEAPNTEAGRLAFLREHAGFLEADTYGGDLRELARQLERQGDRALAKGQLDEAAAAYREAVTVASEIVSGGPSRHAVVALKATVSEPDEPGDLRRRLAAFRRAHDAVTQVPDAPRASVGRLGGLEQPTGVPESTRAYSAGNRPLRAPASVPRADECGATLGSLPRVTSAVSRPSARANLSAPQVEALLQLTGRSTEAPSLFDVVGALVEVTAASGYIERGYYRSRRGCGLTLLTRVEQIEEDGTPVPPPGRFVDPRYPDASTQSLDRLVDDLSSLFFVKRGYSRLLVFTVGAEPVEVAEERTMTPERSMAMLEEGARLPPEQIRDVRLDKNHVVDVLIYEFETVGSDDDVKVEQITRLDAMAHLVGAGLGPLTAIVSGAEGGP